MTPAEITKNVALKHSFSLNTRLPEREIALGSMDNKMQLIHLIAKYIISENVKAFNCRRLFLASADEVPALNGFKTKEIDLCTTHEEVDIIIIQQCYGTVSNG